MASDGLGWPRISSDDLCWPPSSGKSAPSASGAADAFCAGFMAALGRRLSVRQALFWAYVTGQLSALQPCTQLEGSLDDIEELVRLELCDDR